MKKFKNIYKTISVALVIVIFSACGPAFKSANWLGADSGFASNSSIPMIEDGVVGKDALAQPNSAVKTSDGMVAWTTAVTSSTVDLSFELNIPFGKINSISSKLIRAISPYACQSVTGISNSSVEAYGNGEIPCGQLIDAHWKQLLVVPVDTMAGESSGISYQINGFQIPIWLSRGQKSGTYTESSLDEKSEVSLNSSPRFAEDISVRYQPHGKDARFELCMNVPGTTVRGNPFNVSAKAWKKIFGVKISYGSDFGIDPGQASFDYGRGCFAMDFGWKGNQLAPELALSTTVNPYLSNASYSGLEIKIRDWFLNLIDNILGFFKFSITNRVEKLGINKVNGILDKDVESGRWFTKVHGETLLENSGKKITKEMATALTRVGVPASTEDLKVMIKDNCRLIKLSGDKEWTEDLQTLCRDVIEKVQLTIEPFAIDSESAQKGCYDHFGRIHGSRDKWWGRECQYAARFRIVLPIGYESYQTDLKYVISRKISLDRIPDQWREYLEQLNIDDLSLTELLEELESRGFNQVTADDLKNRSQAALAKVRLKKLDFAPENIGVKQLN